jgi:hypothetical protein
VGPALPVLYVRYTMFPILRKAVCLESLRMLQYATFLISMIVRKDFVLTTVTRPHVYSMLFVQTEKHTRTETRFAYIGKQGMSD